MRIPLGNIFEQDLWKKFRATKKANIQVLQSASMHSCNGAYLFATDDPGDWTQPDVYQFENELRRLQKTYFGAWSMSRAA